MEQKMNRKVIGLTIIVIIGMILFPTIYKIVIRHNTNLIKVVENEFSYQAKNCYNDKKCLNKKVYLKELYENKYIESKLTNPINKKYYSEESFIDLESGEIKLIS